MRERDVGDETNSQSKTPSDSAEGRGREFDGSVRGFVTIGDEIHLFQTEQSMLKFKDEHGQFGSQWGWVEKVVYHKEG